MKERQKKMLRFMLLNEGMLHIEDIAEAFSIGKRTVSRDLDVIERWLSFRGAGLERKPNQGIRVLTFGKSEDELLDIVNAPDNYLESLDAAQRQKLILLYLSFNNREIKISTIANAFFISDTSVWSDLNQIEISLKDSGLIIERQKGIGIKLTGMESIIRLTFLSIMTEAFSSNTIIPYLYAIKEDKGSFLEINQLKFLINRLNFSGNNTEIFDVISSIPDKLGYQFTMSGESLLYFYLQLSIHRIKSGALIYDSDFTECSPFFKDLAEDVLNRITARVLNGKLPESEYQFLGLIMQVLESGDFIENSAENYSGYMITDEIISFSEEIISEFGRLDNRQYYLNEQIESVLRATSASMVTRFRNGIPFWHGEWGEPAGEAWNRKQKAEILANLLKQRFGLDSDPRDLDYILLYFHSMIFGKKDLPDKKIRSLVCCFEGIGLAAYLRTVLDREIDTIKIVEATAAFRLKQEYLDANGIELVISTYPVNDLDVPVIPISLPINRELLIKQIEGVVVEMKKGNNTFALPETSQDEGSLGSELSFGKIISFINGFRLIKLASSDDIIKVIDEFPKQLKNTVSNPKKLSKDIRKREALGPLIVEEWGLRILHCKSAAVSEPLAGVISFDEPGSVRMLFMIAPDPCPDEERKMLSTITVSFLDDHSFRDAVLAGRIDEIKKELLMIYQ